LTLIPRGEFSIVLAGIAAAAGLPELAALVALLVLALSLVGTVAMQFTPEITRRVFPRRDDPGLAGRGFNPDLAGFDPGA
ncbi:MAG: cation:proton antiporter, partial [Gemmatimonadota bacterium]|nr:cation:proton antiporter [Gemmatimonadota bacterium]